MTSQSASAVTSNSAELERTYCFDTADSISDRIEGKEGSEGCSLQEGGGGQGGEVRVTSKEAEGTVGRRKQMGKD